MIEWHDFSKEGFPAKDGEYLCLYKCQIFGGETLYPIVIWFTKNMHRFDSFDFPNKEENRPGFMDYDSEYGYSEFGVVYWAEINYPNGGDNG